MIQERSAAPERPRLVLGLLGFSPHQATTIQQTLRRACDSSRDWLLGPLTDADVWWANGARVQVLPDGSVRIGPGVAGSRSVRLKLEDVDRPIAFSEPLACGDLEPACRFRADDASSMLATLAAMERHWLRLKFARLWIAAWLVSHEHLLNGRVYHVVAGGRLLAVVDRAGQIGIAPDVQACEFEHACWVPRPSSARFIPGSFIQVTLSELVWEHALRSASDLLPPRYFARTIYFRRPPKIAQRLLRDEHLLAIGELARGPGTFEELRHRTGMEPAVLSRGLAALYLTGSITCTAQRAGQWSPPGSVADSRGFRGSSQWATESVRGPDSLQDRHRRGIDATAPARLHSH